MTVTLQDFDAFFEAMRNGHYKCVFCGNETFKSNALERSPKQLVEAKLLIAATAENLATGTHDFYSSSCARCGRTDFFHANQVEQWLLARTEDAGA
jgi:predicted nucleic-acid-binding Zn-ribbon protein